MKGYPSLVLVSVVFALACSSSSDPYGGSDNNGGNNNNTSCTSSATKVCMANTQFDPASLTVAKGTTVTWQNADDFRHTVTSNPSNPAGCPTFDNSVAGGATAPGVTFNPANSVTCQYYCSIHASATAGAMRASIIVQ